MKIREEYHCMFICNARGPEEYQLYVHLHCLGQCRIMPGQCRIVHRPCRSRGDECCRSRRLFVGKYPAERISILPSGASSKFHANRHIELTGPDQTAEGFGPGGRAWRTGLRNGTFHGFGLQRGWFRSGGWTFHDAGRFHGGFDSEEWNLPRFRASAWRVPLWMLNLP